MNIEVELYVKGMIDFFKNYPDSLYQLIFEGCEEAFYQKIREAAQNNFENGDDIPLTKEQMVHICADVNRKGGLYLKVHKHKTAFGDIFLN